MPDLGSTEIFMLWSMLAVLYLGAPTIIFVVLAMVKGFSTKTHRVFVALAVLLVVLCTPGVLVIAGFVAGII